jgi:hypothetical protein
MRHKQLYIKDIKTKDVSDKSDTEIDSNFNNITPRVADKKGVKFKLFNKKSSRKQKKQRSRRFYVVLLIVLLFLTLLTSLGIYYIYLPAQRVYRSAKNIQDNTETLLVELQNKDISNLEDRLENIQTEIDKVSTEIDRYDFLQNLDQTKGYYKNFQQGQVILDKSNALITKILPELKNILEISGFKTDDTQQIVSSEGEDEEGATSLILKELPKYLALYESIKPDILDILQEVKKIDHNYVPSLAGLDIKDDLEELNVFIDEYPELSDQVMALMEKMPDLLGSNEPTTYMLVLQNETEMRSSGGLITSVGNVTVANGEIQDNIFLTDTWNLENYISYTLGIDSGYRNIYGQLHLMDLNCGAYYLRAQDTGLYPDLHATMSIFKDYYNIASEYNPADYKPYKHAIMLNYQFSEDLLKILPPIEVEGFGTVTADNLYDFIKADSDKLDRPAGEDRKVIISKIAEALKKQVFNLKLSEMPQLINTIINSFKAKNIALYSPDATMQEYFDNYGLSGRSVKNFDGDYFQFNEAQNCSLKLNKYIRDDVNLTVRINNDGSINNSVKVKWYQTKVYDPSISNFYSPSLNFSYRAWLRFFLPNDTSDINSDGFSRSGYTYYYPREYYDDVMNKQVSDNIIQFDHRRFEESDPIERDEINISYRLPGSINYIEDGGYKLLLEKHPGKAWEKYIINIEHNGGVYTTEFILDRDKILTYKDGVIQVDNYDKKLDWLLTLLGRIPWENLKD